MEYNRTKKILIVEDDEISQFLMKKMLDDLGYQSHVVSNGLEALEILEVEVFDLIFMDMEMPILSGLETVKRIREAGNIKYSNIPIIGISANPFENGLLNFKEKGLNDYITKPVLEQVLLEKIENQL